MKAIDVLPARSRRIWATPRPRAAPDQSRARTTSLPSRLRGRSPPAESVGAAFALGNLYARQQRWSEAQQVYFTAYSLARRQQCRLHFQPCGQPRPTCIRHTSSPCPVLPDGRQRRANHRSVSSSTPVRARNRALRNCSREPRPPSRPTAPLMHPAMNLRPDNWPDPDRWGILSEDQLRIALLEQMKSNQPVGEAAVSLGFVSKPPARCAVGKPRQAEHRTSNVIIDLSALALVPANWKRHHLLPL